MPRNALIRLLSARSLRISHSHITITFQPAVLGASIFLLSPVRLHSSFGCPIFQVGLRNVSRLTAVVRMPKAAMNEDYSTPGSKYQSRLSGKVFPVQSEQ